MTVPISKLRRALDGKHGLTAGQVNDIADTLLASGLASVDPSTDSKLHAAKIQANNAIEREARAVAQRLGLSVSASGEINIAELNASMTGLGLSEKMRHKTLFHAAGMLA
jgi:hypothetical protein